MKKSAWKRKIKADCVQAGTYAEWCDNVIDALAAILEKRDETDEEYRMLGMGATVTHTNKNGAENITKNPALMMWNDLNTSALAYWRDLGLTPSAFRKLTGDAPKKEKVSGLVAALKSLES